MDFKKYVNGERKVLLFFYGDVFYLKTVLNRLIIGKFFDKRGIDLFFIRRLDFGLGGRCLFLVFIFSLKIRGINIKILIGFCVFKL